MQELIAGAVVLLAVSLLAVRIWKAVRPRSCSEPKGGGCGKCGGCG
jgi:hypothetical protein